MAGDPADPPLGIGAPGEPELPANAAWVLAAGGLCALVGTVSLIAVLAADLPLILALFAPFALAAGAFILFNTQTGLCFIAFTIPLLGFLQIEIAGITVNLPELLIGVLFVKEFALFVMNGEEINPLVPAKSLLFFVAASVVGIGTGLRDGWPPVPVLQDFRQFTEFFIFFLLVAHRVRTVSRVRQILVCFVLSGVLIALHGIIQRFTGVGIPGNQLMSDLIYHKGIRAGSIYGATALGALMVLVGGCATGLMLSSRTWLARALWLGCIGACVTASVYSNTRASWLAFLVAFGIVFLFVRKRPFVIAVAIAGGLAVGVVLGSIIMRRIEMTHVSKAERSLLERFDYYVAAWHIFRTHPLFGLGWGCYYDIHSILVNDRYVRVPYRIDATSTVHSAYLQILVKSGAAGLITFLVFLIQWFRRVAPAFFVRNADEGDYNLFLGAAGALLGYLLHATIENFFQWPIMAQAFWMLLGLVLVLAGILLDQQHKAPATPENGS